SARSLQMDWYQMKLKVCAMDYIRGNPGSISSAFLLNLYKVGWGKTLTAEFYDAFSQEVKDTKYGRHIGEYLEVNKNPQVGDKVVDFSLPNPEGRLVSVGDYKGKVLLIEFWSSRCGPCRVENPRLVELYQKFRGSGFEILGVGLEDDRDAWLKAIETDGIPWENVSDLKADENVAAMVYGVSAIPDNVLVDRNGLIIERRISVQELKTQLETLLTKHSEMHERIFRK
ncbi:MAG TPA: TlpA family protein disulfide reductase, partial [Chryseosolibacter sp.]|nr:TlpA family protein disulfide reductase [Chryseosolibacter sp.]